MGTLSSPSERKVISECLPHPAALAGSDKKRSMANLAEFTVNDKVVWEPRENIRRINNTADLLLYKIVFMLRFGDVGNLSLLLLGKDK